MTPSKLWIPRCSSAPLGWQGNSRLPSLLPQNPRKPRCPWEITGAARDGNQNSSCAAIWRICLERRKDLGSFWGEFVFVEFFGEVFLSLWIFLSFLESSSSGFLIRDLGPAQIRGRCFLPIPESWKIQPGAGKTQPGMAKGKSNHRKERKSFPDFGKVPFGNSSWGGKSYQK